MGVKLVGRHTDWAPAGVEVPVRFVHTPVEDEYVKNFRSVSLKSKRKVGDVVLVLD